MLEKILGNIPTIIVAVAVLGLVAGAVIYMIRSRKSGKSSCGGCCGSCPMGGSCHDKK